MRGVSGGALEFGRQLEVERLPPDHPRWQREVLAVSARVRSLLTALLPVVVRALSFWEHAVTALAIGGRRPEVGPCGCYRLR